LDNGALQVHGALQGPPAYLSPAVDYVRGDVCNGAAVLHLAAMVGVGQSMYEVERYTTVDDLGTATLMQALLERPVAGWSSPPR
jgi:dTDP-L-rhamnose 4-epimerase